MNCAEACASVRWIMVLLAACAVCRGQDATPNPGGSGCVGYWRFEETEGAGVRDYSGYGNGGVMLGGERVPGKRGMGISFLSAGSAVRIPYQASLNLGQAMTFEAWMKPQDLSAESRILVSKNDEYTVRVDNPNEGGRVSFFVHVGDPAVKWEPRVSSTPVEVGDGWIHVVAVWTGEESRIYLNGVLAGTRARRGRPNPNPYPLMIGNWEYPSCHGTNFGGILDEVRLYNRALSETEIRQHYDEEK